MKRILFMILCGVLWGSCTDNDEFNVRQQEEGKSFSLQIFSVTRDDATDALTRAPELVAAGESIGIYLQGTKKTGETECIPVYNRKYMHMGAGWGPIQATDTIYLYQEKAQISAYYPYDADMKYIATSYNEETGAETGKTEYPNMIPLTTQPYDQSKELFIDVHKEADLWSRKVIFNLTHAYSRLKLSIVKGDNYPLSVCKLTSVTLANDSLFSKGVLDLTDGKVKTLPDDIYRREIGQYTVPASCGTGSSLPYEFNAVNTQYQIDLLVVSTQLKPDASDGTKGLAIVVNVGGLPATVMVPLTDLSAFEHGKEYTISMQLNGVELSPPTVTITGWDEKILNGGVDYEPMP